MSKSKAYGYFVDLGRLQFGDKDGTWIQAMPLGEYEHPVYGPINITPEKVSQFADNVNNQVRGTDLDIDYDHKKNGGEAAGWVKKAEARDDGLWLFIEWTKSAYQKLKEKAYRYFSPEFNDEWTHPKTGETHHNVLFGGAITNRPFLKDILAINMSELVNQGAAEPPGAEPPTPAPTNPEPSKGGHMDPKKLREILGLGENATDEEVTAKLTQLAEPPAQPTPVEPPAAPASPEEVARLIKQLQDVDGNPAMKALTDLVQAQQKTLESMAWERHTQFVERQLADLDNELKGKQLAVPPAVKDQLREILLKSPKALGEQVYNAYKQTLTMGLIDMGERGWQRRGEETSPTQRYLSEIDQVMADATAKGKKMSYADAAAQVARMNPQLAQDYREDSYIPSEGR